MVAVVLRGGAGGGLYTAGMALASDTDPEARSAQIAAFRRMTPEQRVALAIELSEEMMELSRLGRSRRAGSSSKRLRS